MTTNIQLENEAEKLNFRNFRGVIMRDEIKKLKKLKQECGILGSKTSREDDMHWTCWFIDGKNKYYFDSFGLMPAKEIYKYLKSPIVYSTFQIQQFNEINCGEWCIYVLHRLNSGDEYVDILLDLINIKTY
jgi:hypothetical protein